MKGLFAIALWALLPAGAAWGDVAFRLEPSASTGGRYSSNLTLSAPAGTAGGYLFLSPSLAADLRTGFAELRATYAPQLLAPHLSDASWSESIQHRIQGSLDLRSEVGLRVFASGEYRQSLFGTAIDTLGLVPNSAVSGAAGLTYELSERLAVRAGGQISQISYQAKPYSDLNGRTLGLSQAVLVRLLLKLSVSLEAEEQRTTYAARGPASSYLGYLGISGQITPKLELRARAGGGVRRDEDAPQVPLWLADLQVVDDLSPVTRFSLRLSREVQDAFVRGPFITANSASLEVSYQPWYALVLAPRVQADWVQYQGDPNRDLLLRGDVTLRFNLGWAMWLEVSGGESRRTSRAPEQAYREQHLMLSMFWYPSGHP